MIDKQGLMNVGYSEDPLEGRLCKVILNLLEFHDGHKWMGIQH